LSPLFQCCGTGTAKIQKFSGKPVDILPKLAGFFGKFREKPIKNSRPLGRLSG
jgi:hypothetical protein